jgi:hypothetical protein
MIFEENFKSLHDIFELIIIKMNMEYQDAILLSLKEK